MLTRILSGVIGSSLVILALVCNKDFPIIVNLLIAVASLMCTVEIIKAKGLLKDYKISVPCMLFAAVTPMLMSTDYMVAVLFLFTLTMFIIMLLNHEVFSFSDLAFVYTSVFVITMGLSSIISMCDHDRNHTGFIVILCLSIPWIADAGAYFIGSFFGKHKLCPKISPKKTIEGAVGGTVLGVLGTFAVVFIFQTWLFNSGEQVNYLNLFIISFLGTIISVVGDLSFSLIKRSCHVKDYGSVIPGHGGLLDRCDSVIFTSPFIMLAVNFLPIIT